MWDVVHEVGLTAGLGMGGCGLGDCHEINPKLLHKLTPGCYDLNEIELQLTESEVG